MLPYLFPFKILSNRTPPEGALTIEFFDTALNNKELVDYVIRNLSNANFDPELFTSHNHEIQKQFNNQFATVQ